MIEIIEGYLQKHEKFEESIADKVHDELLSIYDKDVKDVPTRYAPFINILRRLRPLIGQPAKVMQWWEQLLPVFDVLNQEKDLATEGQNILLDILTADDSNDAESPTGGAAVPLGEKVLRFWMDDCGRAAKGEGPLALFKEKQLRQVLIIYGKKHPRDFMTLLDKHMVDKAWRAHALNLLADFVQSQPPHLHQVLQTPLFGTLINALQLDTSTTIVSLALTVLTMILPHIPSSLVPHLPTLFNIYARLLFWERELSAIELGVSLGAEKRPPPGASTWQKMSYSPDFDGNAVPQLMNYFTILYGLYPINLMDYIRKPQRYLRHAEAPDPDEIEVQPTEIRHASEHFRQCHLLHENFYTLTIDSEKTDFGRWIKSEPAEVVADCVALRQPMGFESGQDPQFAPFRAPALSIRGNADTEGLDPALLSTSFPAGFSPYGTGPGDTWHSMHSMPFESPTSSRTQALAFRRSSISSRQSQHDATSIRPSAKGGESPMLQGQIASYGSQTHLQDMINSNKVIKSTLNQSLANDSVPSLALSHHESLADRPAPTTQPSQQTAISPSLPNAQTDDQQITHLYRQILLLHNDLTFERFMKQQHLAHMGELRRRQMREAASEAETQNLIMANRHLKQRLEEAKKLETQTKKESERSRTLAKKWEADLSAKLRTLREEQKRWNAESEAFERDIEAMKTETDKLRTLVCEGETRELGWKQRVQSVEADANELERLRKEVERLTVSERHLQAQEMERQVAITRASESDSKAEMLGLKLTAHDAEYRQAHDLYQKQIAELNAKLQEALRNASGEKKSDHLKVQFESVMAASRAQQTELKKRVAELAQKNTALSGTILELQATLASQSKSGPARPASPDLDDSDPGSPNSQQDRAEQQDSSDAEDTDAMSFGTARSTEPYSSSLHLGLGSHMPRPSTPSVAEGSDATSMSSPKTERYHGRGAS